MDRETLEKAIALSDRIGKLEILERDLRPGFCNGVGVCATLSAKTPAVTYRYDFRSSKSDTDDRSLIMRIGIEAMHEEVCRLLVEAKHEPEEL